MASDATLNHEYLPVPGNPDYREAGFRLLLGDDSPAVTENRVDAVQSCGGTGALRIGFDFLHNQLKADTIYVSKPTWGNHKDIAKSVGYSNIREYRYWNESDRSLDINGFIEDLQNAPAGSVIVLHTCAHNPTGVDPTLNDWARLAEVIKEKKLFPFFDTAYQGFASGDFTQDTEALTYFVNQGFELFAAQSFSKNFGLYNERVGNLVFVASSPDVLPKIRSQLVLIVRRAWSNPPAHGSRVVGTILNNPALRADWKQCVSEMANRIKLMRKELYDRLRALGTPGNWNHIISQKGMFSYTGLNRRQCEFLINEKHIYLLRSGRINMCGLNFKNIDYVANAIHEAVTTETKL